MAILPAVPAPPDEGQGGLAAQAGLAVGNLARASGLTDRGAAIRPGLRAGLLLADDEEGIGHVRQTPRGGRVVYSRGALPAPALAAWAGLAA